MRVDPRCAATRRDRGQATVLLLALIALTAVMIAATARFAGRVVARERAQAAADAAALAAIDGGRAAASRLAAANEGTLIAFAQTGEDAQLTVQVTVRVDGEVATARATRAP